jgi:hypothetical protein
MTVSSTVTSQTFAGGQSVLTFSYRALVSNPNYIQVSVVALSGGAVTPLVYNVGYTVSINASGVGGTVTVSPTYSTAYNYVVYRQTAILQSSAYSDYNSFPASTLENDLDTGIMIEQEANTNYSLLLTYPVGTSTSYSTTMPLPVAGYAIIGNSNSTGYVSALITGSAGAIGPSGSGLTLVSSSTTDLTVVSTPSSATITAVNAGTGGTNTILRLNSSGYLPALNGSLLTNLSFFSSQNVVTGSRNLSSSGNHVYQNTTGKTMLVTVSISCSGNNTNPIVKTDSSATPTTAVLGTYNASNTNAWLTITFIVLNNNYYLVETAGAGTLQYWTEWY